MLDGLRSVAGGDSALSFVLQFCGNPSSYLWEDDLGETCEILRGKSQSMGIRGQSILSFYRMSASLLSTTTSTSSLRADSGDP